jgi:aspartate/glutamate racemase
MLLRPFSKSIGIIGGAGPAASAFLYSCLLRFCQQEYHSNDYAELPEIILVSYPFIRGDDKKMRAQIRTCFSKLKKAGASLLCLASHSLHAFLPLRPPAGFVNLVKESLKEAKRLKISKALILCSETTISLRLYERQGIDCLYPPSSDQRCINQLIRDVAGGKINAAQSKKLQHMINRLQKTLAFDGVLIACTELPLIHAKRPIAPKTIPTVDTIQVLAQVLVETSRKK